MASVSFRDGYGGALTLSPPSGITVTVNITGGTVTSDAAGTTAVTFPQTVNSKTTYYAPENGTRTVSCTWQGVEVANGNGGTFPWLPKDGTSATISPCPTDLQGETSGSATSAPDATASVKGIVQLAGDLGGTAASPTVPGLAGKVNALSGAYPTTSTLMGVLAQVLGWWDIRDFGAKCDYQQSQLHATWTAGSNITVTDAAFTSADQGKTFFLEGAGAAGADLVTTISAVVDATHVTLTTPPTTAGTNKTATWGTDDTVAIRAAFDACYAAARANGQSSSVVYLPGWSMVAGAINANGAVITVPSNPVLFGTGNGRLPNIRLQGVGGAQITYDQIGTEPPIVAGSGIFCPTIGTTNQAVINAGPFGSSFYNVSLEVVGVTMRQPNNPTLIDVDGWVAQTLVLRDYAADLVVPETAMIQPTHTWTAGARFPQKNNGAALRTEGTCLSIGRWNGLNISEHFKNVGTYIGQRNNNGYLINSSIHGMDLGRSLLQGNKNQIASAGTAGEAKQYSVTATMIDTEHGGYYVNDINDPNGNLVGVLPWRVGGGGTETFTLTNTQPAGGLSVKVFMLDIPPGAYTWALPASGVASTPVWRDLILNVTGGTVTAISVGGVAVNPAATTIHVPSGQAVTFTYSVAPTVTALAV